MLWLAKLQTIITVLYFTRSIYRPYTYIQDVLFKSQEPQQFQYSTITQNNGV
jgi:hypothetical protein